MPSFPESPYSRGYRPAPKPARPPFPALAIACLAFSAFSAFPARAQEIHPRLFLTADKVDSVRARIAVPGSFHAHAYAQLKARVDAGDPAPYALAGYDRPLMARESAFMYQLTGDTAYAQKAYALLQAIMAADTSAGRPDNDPKAIDRAAACTGFTYAYDWCYAAWSDDQRKWVRDALVKSLDEWTEFEIPVMGWGDGTNQVWQPYISNWVAVCQGTQILMYQATYLEGSSETNVYKGSDGSVVRGLTRKQRYQDVRDQFIAHATRAYGNLGVTGEGIAYLGYSGNFLFPALRALRDAGDPKAAALPPHEWWKWLLYASSFTPDFMALQNGPAGAGGVSDLGVASLLLGQAPAEARPYYLYFYDRYMGELSAAPPAKRYDPVWDGTVWALLDYPADAAGADPTPDLPKLAADTVMGGFFFRNRWRDSNDVLFSIFSDSKSESGVHNTPEAFQIQFVGYGNKFIGGPGREYRMDLMSALYVDTAGYNPGIAKPMSATGATRWWAYTARGGYVSVDGGDKYRALGLDSARRECYVEFPDSSNSAVITTLDAARAPKSHTFSWQLNIGDENGDRGLVTSADTFQGRPMFRVRDARGGSLRGYVLSPDSVTIITGDPLKVQATGKRADLWVAMVADSVETLDPTITGSGLSATFSYRGATVTYDSATGRFRGAPTIVGIARRSAASPRGPLLVEGHGIRGGGAELSFRLPGASPFSAELRDMSGRLVARASGLGRAGANSATLGAPGGLKPGSYLVRLSAGGATGAGKIAILP